MQHPILGALRASCRITLLAVIASAAHGIDLDSDFWVTVGDPGNACDTQPQGCFGSVDYTYLIGKYEVTNAQYAEFLNAVAASDPSELYNAAMGNAGAKGGITRSGSPGSYTYGTIAGRENMPVNYVSFWDAVRFANWLHNGQPTGPQGNATTQDGAYTLVGLSYRPTNECTVTRNAGATIFIPSEDEWYKAAYFNGTSYFDYPARTDTPTVCATPGPSPNTANCGWPPAVDDLTFVGSYTESASPYGTFDQGGNLEEVNDDLWPGCGRGLRGGGYNGDASVLAASSRNNSPGEFHSCGFRVASTILPDPPACDDGIDNDGDGLIDDPGDPGCESPSDDSETDETGAYPCDDGIDNEQPVGDTFVDFRADGSGDPGCKGPEWFTEEPECQDGIDNDGEIGTDFDGGESVLGVGKGDLNGPDPNCFVSWKRTEAPSTGPCGLGAELALFLPPVMWLFWRRRRSIH